MERIRMIGLGKSFGVRQVFSNVSFELKEGDRLALVGPNGAGKSTLLKCILGYEELDEGNVVKSPVASIGYLQQDVNLGDDSRLTQMLSVKDNIAQQWPVGRAQASHPARPTNFIGAE